MAPDHDVEWPPFDDDDVREILLRYGPVAASLLSDLSDVLGIGHLKPIAFLAEAIALKAVRAVSKKAQCHLLGKKILQLVGGYIFACRAQQSFFSPLHLRIAIEFSNKFQAVYILIESCQRGHKTTDSDDVFLELIRDLENLKHYLVEDEYFARAISFPERHYRYVVKIKNVLGTGYFPCSPVSLTSAEAAKCQCDRLLPAQGRRLLGRDRELKILLFPVHRSLPVRQRICGPRGVGKTALALSFVHHESVRSAYEHRRFFVCCDAARSVDDLKACIARHLDLHSHDVLVYLRDLSYQGPALLILDHLDLIWEDELQRPALVKFLLQLSNRTRMSFIITVTAWIDTEDSCLSIWSQPLLYPLRPLAPNDALELMSVVAAQSPRTPYFYELLTSAKGLPFVLTMFGNLMGFHGSTHVWTSWSNWVTTTDLKPFEGSRTREATAFAQTCCLSGAPKEAQEFLDVLSMAPDGVDVSLISKFIPDSVELHKCCRSLKLLGFAQSTRDRQVLVSPLPVRTSVKRSRAQGTQGVKRMCDGLVLALRLYSTVGLAPSSNIVRHIKENVNNIASFLADAAEDPTLDEDDLMSLILGTIEFGRFSRHTGWFPGAKASLARFGDRMLRPETSAKVKGEFFLGMAQWPETQDYYLHCAENVYTKVNDASGLGRCYITRGRALISAGRLSDAIDCFEHALNIASSMQDNGETLLCEAQWDLGFTLLRLRRRRKAHRLFEKVLALSISLKNLYFKACALQALSLCLLAGSYYVPAEQYCEEAVRLLRCLSLPTYELDELRAHIHLQRSEYDAAAHLFNHCAQIQGTTPRLKFLRACSLVNAVVSECKAGKAASDGLMRIGRASSVFLRCKDTDGLVECTMAAAHWHFTSGLFAEASQLFRLCLSSTYSRRGVKAVCYMMLGEIAQKHGHLHTAMQLYILCLLHSRSSGLGKVCHQALVRMGDIFLIWSNAQTAANLFIIAGHAFQKMGVHKDLADCFLRIGDLHVESRYAKEFWQGALPLYRRHSHLHPGVSECIERLRRSGERTRLGNWVVNVYSHRM